MTARIEGGQPESFEIQAAATAPIASPAKARSWLDTEHPRYVSMLPRWGLVSDFYMGEVADPECAREHLVKRFQGEPDEAFTERVTTVDYTPHLGTLVDTLAGMLFAVEDRATMVWTDEENRGGLGDPNKVGSPAHRLLSDADGQGCAWTALWRRATLDLICYQYMWFLVDTVRGQPVVKLVLPASVPNWVDGPTGPIDVLMREHVDTRTSLMNEPTPRETFIRWTLTGWERWQRDKEGVAVQLPGPTNSGTYKYVDRQGAPTLPIFRVELPIRRYVTWLLARKAAVLFNQESVRDFALRIASFAKLVITVASANQAETLRAKLKAGDNVIEEDAQALGGHRYIVPPSTAIDAANAIIDKKVEHFWVSGFKQYADAARLRTATEVKQEVAAGVGAFLQLLKAAVDDAENGALHRLEQAERKDTPTAWGVARVERSDDFSSVDLGAVLDQLRARYLGATGTVPVGRSAMIELAQQAARQDGLPVNKDEITAAVDAQLLSARLPDLERLGAMPALVRARLTMRLVAALGLVDPKEEILLSDGTKSKLLTLLQGQAEELAQAKAEADRRLAELPPVNPFT